MEVNYSEDARGVLEVDGGECRGLGRRTLRKFSYVLSN